jgi:cation diffusion facilitator CzcD-associated flavoprotein CzcO
VTQPVEVDVVIVGAGFGGLGMAIEMRRRDLGTYVVLERSGDIGGTWRDNTYPGACCDVPGALYRYSFAPQAWSRRYPPQEEILSYLRRCAARYRVLGRVALNEEVLGIAWDAASERWEVDATGGRWRGRHVVLALGQLSRPAPAEIDRLDTFTGATFHSARWRHDVDLAGRRVGVIGTGASAIQIVPRVAEVAQRVTVFQRSAPYVLAKADRSSTATSRAAQRALPWLQLPARARYFLAGEEMASAIGGDERRRDRLAARWRDLRDRDVPEGDLRVKTTPDYPFGCKRVLFADDWYRTVVRDDVELVTAAIDHVDGAAVVTSDGARHDLDVLVHATGFETRSFVGELEVLGRGGARLSDVWSTRPFAHRGVEVPGFPNLHLLYGPNTNLGSNSVVYMLEAQIGYVAGLIRAGRDGHVGSLEVTEAAAAEWLEGIDAASATSSWLAGCSSWYTAGGLNTHNWPHRARRYHRLLREIDLRNYRPVLPATDPAADGGAGPVSST